MMNKMRKLTLALAACVTLAASPANAATIVYDYYHNGQHVGQTVMNSQGVVCMYWGYGTSDFVYTYYEGADPC